MVDVINPLGNIYINHRAIAAVAYQTALLSYGVVGLTAKNLAKGLSQALIKDPTLGVDIHFYGKEMSIDLYVIVEYGTRIKSVASSVSDNVRFQVQKIIGLPVNQVNVHIRGLRISNPD